MQKCEKRMISSVTHILRLLHQQIPGALQRWSFLEHISPKRKTIKYFQNFPACLATGREPEFKRQPAMSRESVVCLNHPQNTKPARHPGALQQGKSRGRAGRTYFCAPGIACITSGCNMVNIILLRAKWLCYYLSIELHKKPHIPR